MSSEISAKEIMSNIFKDYESYPSHKKHRRREYKRGNENVSVKLMIGY